MRIVLLRGWNMGVAEGWVEGEGMRGWTREGCERKRGEERERERRRA